MTIGIIKNDLMARDLTDKMKDVLPKSYVRSMDFTSRPLKEFIYVSEEGF